MSDYLKKCYKKQNISLLLLLKQKYQLMNTYSYHKVMLIHLIAYLLNNYSLF